MKIRAKQTFQYENNEFEKGTVHELPGSVAEQAIEKGYAEKVEEEEEETPKIEAAEEERTPEMEKSEGGSGGTEAESGEEEGTWGKVEEKLDEEAPTPPTWNPTEDENGNLPDSEEVDDLKGTINDIRENVGRNENDVITVVTPDGEERGVWKHIALEGLFEKAEIGDHVGVRFTGISKSQAGRKYHNYRYELYDEDWNHKDSG